MRLIIIIKLFVICSFSFADTSVCRNSPIILNSKDDWEKHKIFEWNNCYGQLKQNYKNKKKWKSHFKNGLPNGYGTVEYENWNGHYQGYFKDGKIVGVGKYVNDKGKIIDIYCEKNACYRKNVDLRDYKNSKSFNYKDNIHKEKKYINNAKVFINKIESLDSNNNKNQLLDSYINKSSKIKNITLNNNSFNYNAKSYSNKTIKTPKKKIIKYFK